MRVARLQMREKKVGRFVFCTVTVTCGFTLKVGVDCVLLETVQNFKFKVVARFPTDSEWTLTGRRIEKAISTMALMQQGP